MDIPVGFTLVPVHPTERMLTEFAGIWAPDLPRAKRDVELAAYNMMIMVAPTPPYGGMAEIQMLREQVDLLESRLRQTINELKNAKKQHLNNTRQTYAKVNRLETELKSLKQER